MVREIKGLKFRETQFIKPGEVYQYCYDGEIQNLTERELAIRIAPNREHKELGDSFGKMSVTVLQIYEDNSYPTVINMKDKILFSDRMVRGCLTEPKTIATISEELNMNEHSVIQSLMKLYKNEEIDWYYRDIPQFYLISEERK